MDNPIKKINIREAGIDHTMPIGAEAENIIVSRNSSGKIIEDLKYDTPDSTKEQRVSATLRNIEDKLEPLAQGGASITQATLTDSTVNGVTLAVSGSQYGYLNAQGQFTSFRQPTGNATTAQVLRGYTFSNGSSDGLQGNMSNNGAVSKSLNCGENYTVPAGYHNGSGKVTANSLSSQTQANATTATILNNYTAWVNGSKITGKMANNGAVSPNALACGTTYTVPAGYHNGSGKVVAKTLASQTGVESGKTGIVAGAVLSGYQGWYNGSRITGNIINRGALNWTPDKGGTQAVEAGYYLGGTLDSRTAYNNGNSTGYNSAKNKALGTNNSTITNLNSIISLAGNIINNANKTSDSAVATRIAKAESIQSIASNIIALLQSL